jgi:hypothetical protein
MHLKEHTKINSRIIVGPSVTSRTHVYSDRRFEVDTVL